MSRQSREPAVLHVLAGGALTTVQDSGRMGLAALGVGPSGPCDRAAHALANRLVGNDEAAATLEVTFGGLQVRPSADVLVALTGARCPDLPYAAPFSVQAGRTLLLGRPVSGLRSYLAVRGGVGVPPVLGSRSTDLLAELGPPFVAAGGDLAVGTLQRDFPNVDVAPVAEPADGEVTLHVLPGPRRDWFTDAGWETFIGSGYTVTSNANRVGIRVDGQPLERSRTGELPTEGMLRGAVQVPPSGLPVIFLADHPVTGGYPVIGYVDEPDLDRCGQLVPGQPIRFAPAA